MQLLLSHFYWALTVCRTQPRKNIPLSPYNWNFDIQRMVSLLRHSFFCKKKKKKKIPLYIYSFEKKCAKHSEVIKTEKTYAFKWGVWRRIQWPRAELNQFYMQPSYHNLSRWQLLLYKGVTLYQGPVLKHLMVPRLWQFRRNGYLT